MALSEHYLTDDLHPIDIVENVAAHNDWQFDRSGDDHITLEVEGQWRTYSITLVWSHRDETLRMGCTFEMDPPPNKLPELYEMLNQVNDQCWVGAFTYWAEEKMMIYRYCLLMCGGQGAGPEQIDAMISNGVLAAERYYPAFQMVLWANRAPRDAMQVAIAQAYGRA
ncbi:MAG: YbjN domain-containing protein [Rhodobacterales bacterium]|nr:YbjN domain-containing protein [Rhodobacterales bacterium]